MVKLTEELILARARSRSLEAVKNLNCWGSGLSDVLIVRKMRNIEVINASTNNIENLQAFSQCSNLRELYLRKNNIKNLNEIIHLKDLSELRVLWLSDNPCCDNINDLQYRMTVLKILPMLTKLDNITVTSEEIERAGTEGKDLSEPEVSPPASIPAVREIPVNFINDEDIGDHVSSEKCTHTEPPEIYGGAPNGCMSVDETNHLREEVGLKPLPSIEDPRQIQRDTLSQTTTSINILTATLSLVKELDEESLRTLQDAVQDRLHILQLEQHLDAEESYDTSLSSNLTNGTTSPQHKDNQILAEIS